MHPILPPPAHREFHRIDRIGWLRAALLGANDGLISTGSLVVGMASAGLGSQPLLLAATAGLAAGALSMAAGEYTSVSSQRDAEEADLVALAWLPDAVARATYAHLHAPARARIGDR